MNVKIKTAPTGRSPKGKFFFGDATRLLDKSRNEDVQIGKIEDFENMFSLFNDLDSYSHSLYFRSNSKNFNVRTTSDWHAKFVQNMFDAMSDAYANRPLIKNEDWLILHNLDIDVDPTIWINLDANLILIAGTSYLGEIKKSVFTAMGFELPLEDKLPMHCGSFTYKDTTNLMFGLSGTGKTTLSSDPDFKLIGDDELSWSDSGLELIETGCYAKTQGLHPKTHEAIYEAMEAARENDVLIEENIGHDNARSSYPAKLIKNSWLSDLNECDHVFDHPNNIFFLTMDVTGVVPPISRIKGDAIKLFFETGYTSKMPGTEDGVNEIKKVFSPCYGGPFMPLPVEKYSDMLVKKINQHDCKVFLVNTGMDSNGERFDLDFTRRSIKHVITDKFETNSFSFSNGIVLEPVNIDSSSKVCRDSLNKFIDEIIAIQTCS